MASTGEPPRLGHLPALDGVRGVAVLLVVADHSGFLPYAAGVAGVAVFFVLSGYLITGKLLEPGRSLGRFYGDRAVRLLPALALLVTGVGLIWWVEGRAVHPFLISAGQALFYVKNFVVNGNDPLAQTWSLATEEQFYLLWPLLLVWLVRRSVPVRRLMLIGLAVLFVALRVRFTDLGFGDFAYRNLLTNAYAMVLGGALTLGCVRWLEGQRRAAVWAGALLLAVTSLFGYQLFGDVNTSPVAAVAGLLLMVGVLDGSRLLEWAPLRFAGRVSYAWYLWHWPLLWLVGADFHAGWASAGVVLLSLGLATASTFWVEEPLRRRWREHVASRRALVALLAN